MPTRAQIINTIIVQLRFQLQLKFDLDKRIEEWKEWEEAEQPTDKYKNLMRMNKRAISLIHTILDNIGSLSREKIHPLRYFLDTYNTLLGQQKANLSKYMEVEIPPFDPKQIGLDIEQYIPFAVTPLEYATFQCTQDDRRKHVLEEAQAYLARPTASAPVPPVSANSSTVGGSIFDDSIFDDSTVGASTVGASTVGGSIFDDSIFDDSIFDDSIFHDSTVGGSAVGASTVGGSTVGGSIFDDSIFDDSTVGGSAVAMLANNFRFEGDGPKKNSSPSSSLPYPQPISGYSAPSAPPPAPTFVQPNRGLEAPLMGSHPSQASSSSNPHHLEQQLPTTRSKSATIRRRSSQAQVINTITSQLSFQFQLKFDLDKRWKEIEQYHVFLSRNKRARQSIVTILYDIESYSSQVNVSLRRHLSNYDTLLKEQRADLLEDVEPPPFDPIKIHSSLCTIGAQGKNGSKKNKTHIARHADSVSMPPDSVSMPPDFVPVPPDFIYNLSLNDPIFAGLDPVAPDFSDDSISKRFDLFEADFLNISGENSNHPHALAPQPIAESAALSAPPPAPTFFQPTRLKNPLMGTHRPSQMSASSDPRNVNRTLHSTPNKSASTIVRRDHSHASTPRRPENSSSSRVPPSSQTRVRIFQQQHPGQKAAVSQPPMTPGSSPSNHG